MTTCFGLLEDLEKVEISGNLQTGKVVEMSLYFVHVMKITYLILEHCLNLSPDVKVLLRTLQYCKEKPCSNSLSHTCKRPPLGQSD